MIPRKRLAQQGLDGLGEDNIVRVPWRDHQLYHRVFDTMMPDEAVLCVLKHWAPDNFLRRVIVRVRWRHLRKTYDLFENAPLPQAVAEYEITPKRKIAFAQLFRKKRILGILRWLVNYWSPRGYFKQLKVFLNNRKQPLQLATIPR